VILVTNKGKETQVYGNGFGITDLDKITGKRIGIIYK
jgi:hypothetical protein